ncbi:MAG TPA: endonuclease/exonuclease/phosphatase family protein, partial [Paracoccaceae bacterium]|nr:endonuclease/exonuclease/phosphatase family protein [Paracoccaceae bacterium]
MILVTWNIQCGKGTDGRVDLDRIVEVLTADGVPDIICLQEVARHMPSLDGGDGADQPAELARRLPGFEAAFGAGVDRQGAGGARAQLGNLILSRLPIVQIFRHLLPQPAETGVRHMPRQATEAVV